MEGLTGQVLITGGTGTLGHAIAARAQREGWPCKLTIASRDPLKQQAMRREYPQHRYVLADVTDREAWPNICAGHDLVIHAAANKHIPECERQPWLSYRTNVLGSVNVLDAAERAGVWQIVLISTDKACWPVNSYGAAKLSAERIYQERAASQGGLRVNLVRYGNVLGSNGSVLPVWQGALSRGEHARITDPVMTRFWLTEDEAVDLILFSLGEPHGSITIPALPALSMHELAQAVLPPVASGYDVIGLRPGEKMHEMLVSPQEAYYADPVPGTRYIRLAPVTCIPRTAPSYPHGYTSDIAPEPAPDSPVAGVLADWRERLRVASEEPWLTKGGAR